MEFTRQKPSARFVVPDKITVRQQLAYFSAADNPNVPTFERFWLAALQLISEWECELFPDQTVSIDEITDPKITNVIIWAGVKVRNHINSLDEISPN